MMIVQVVTIGFLASFLTCALAIANILQLKLGSAAPGRALAGMMGGLAYCAGILWLNAWVALTVSVLVLTLLVLGVLTRRSVLGGIQGERSGQRWSEVSYLVGGTLGLVGVILLQDWRLPLTAIGFMAWGDATASLIRTTTRGRHEGGSLPSSGMVVTCLAVAALVSPYWIGAAGALTASFVERKRLVFHSGWDDNWLIVVTSLSVMAVLTAAYDGSFPASQ